MTDLHPVTAVVTGVLGLAAGALVPRLIAWVPEPTEPDPGENDGGEKDGGEKGGGEKGAEPEKARPEEPKEPYADIAARPGLLWKTALAAGVSAAAIGLVLGWDLSLLVVLPLVPVAVALAVIDWRTRLLPTKLVAPSYVLTIVTVLLAWLLGDRELHDLERAALGWLIYGGMFFLLWFIYPSGLGYGDVRLSGVLGLALGWLGWPELWVGIGAGLILGGVGGGLLSLVTRRRDYPFGPFMLLGALIGVAAGQPLITALYG